MVKTRSQTKNITIKSEEEDSKGNLLLNGASTTRNKITKQRSSRNKNNLPTQQVKIEEDIDSKSLSKLLKKVKKPRVSQEQINGLIDAIVNDNMGIPNAARKVKMGYVTACSYYNKYKNDPEKKIPVARNQNIQNRATYTQEHIENLIKYINDDKMTVEEASSKASMTYKSGSYYYKKHLQDPDHKIPIPQSCQHYTQDQRNELIGYIINDKMNIAAASKKAKMNCTSAAKYYYEYLKDPKNDNPIPGHINRCKPHSRELIKKVISYIVDDKMSIRAASRKAKISQSACTIHYRKYLKDNNMEIPTPKIKAYSQDKINQLISYIDDDKMTIREASKKVHMNESSGGKHYQQYLKNHNIHQPNRLYTQDQKQQFISSIFDDKMSMKEALEKAKISYRCGRKCYKRYLKSHNLDMHKPARKYTQDKINEFIGYIIDDKMVVATAAKKANIPSTTARKYYKHYLNDRKR